MAKKRKSTKKVTRRRTKRGLGAVNVGGMVMQIGGVLAGVALAGYVNKFFFTPKDGQTASETQTTLGKYAPLALGVITPMVLKSDLGKNLGSGMIAYGGAKILQSAGLGADNEISIGYDNLSAVAGDGLSALAGDDDFAMAGDDDFAMAGDDDDSVMA